MQCSVYIKYAADRKLNFLYRQTYWSLAFPHGYYVMLDAKTIPKVCRKEGYIVLVWITNILLCRIYAPGIWSATYLIFTISPRNTVGYNFSDIVKLQITLIVICIENNSTCLMTMVRIARVMLLWLKLDTLHGKMHGTDNVLYLKHRRHYDRCWSSWITSGPWAYNVSALRVINMWNNIYINST